MVTRLMCILAKQWAPQLQGNDPESQAWAAFDASRRAQMRTAGRAQRNTVVRAAAPSQARAASHSPEPIAPTSPVPPRCTFDVARRCALYLLTVSSVDSLDHKGFADLLC